ncbi:MAG: hypothetical protein K6E51_01235 [Treponema sp.]|nr:hypothetical protein [Treponema sp.]
MSARQIADAATKKGNVLDSIAYIKTQLDNTVSAADKRATYAFLGTVQEQLSLFQDASASYAAAAGIAAGDAKDMPRKSSEQLVIDAVRCALSYGDCDTADSYLHSAVQKSTDETIQAYIRLYTQWSVLSRANSTVDLTEPVAVLQAYTEIPSLKVIKPSVLLTLWYVTGEAKYGDTLKKEFASSLEAAVVGGKASLLPAPFWYFVPRLGVAQPEVSGDDVQPAQAASPAKEVTPKEKQSSKATADSEKPVRQQLGLFRELTNAQHLVDTLKQKGFTAQITSQKRPSGITYYIVSVKENELGDMGTQLRTAGFECYPLFD